MSDDDLWKEQLAFISGNILAWGLIVLNLWPTLSHFQTGMNIHLWTTNWPQEGIKTELQIFWMMTALLALASSVTVFAIVHILSRGIWLILPIKTHQDSILTDIQNSLDRFCQNTYYAIFILAIYVAFLLFVSIFLVLGTVLEQFLLFLSLPLSIAGWIARGIVLFFILVLFLVFWKKISKKLWSVSIQNPISVFKTVFISLAIFFVAWFITIEAVYTMDLTVNEKIFDQTKGDIVEIYVTLGGSTSAVDVAKLGILDSHGTLINNLTMYSIGQGQYASYILPTTLPEGRYEVVLEYPHSSLSSSYPFISSENRKSQGFIVVP